MIEHDSLSPRDVGCSVRYTVRTEQGLRQHTGTLKGWTRQNLVIEFKRNYGARGVVELVKFEDAEFI